MLNHILATPEVRCSMSIMEIFDKNILKRIYIKEYYIYYTDFHVNEVQESEFGIRFGVTPISDVLKIEHCRFSALPCNKKNGFDQL